MNLNDFMHPRNPYRKPPNFTELAQLYPAFEKCLIKGKKNKMRVDFKDCNSLRTFTQTLLAHDFQLDVAIPDNRLIPTLPLRLNYILWIEDLLSVDDRTRETVKGFDVGTGATCIYPLLGHRKNGWAFIATESDKLSMEHARLNVQKNGLNEFIYVRLAPEDTLLIGNIKDSDSTFDFCMCNPPFFGSEWEHDESDEEKCRTSIPSNPGCSAEKVVDGGEIKFVERIVEESLILKEKIRIFTTMLGKKSSLKVIKGKLSHYEEIQDVTTAQFCQGKTIRWAIAWTFVKGIDLKKVKLVKHNPKNPPMIWTLPSTLKGEPTCLNSADDFLLEIFNDLNIDTQHKAIMKKDKLNKFVFELCAKRNTWIHQRRKRRAALFQQKETYKDDPENSAKRKLDEADSPATKRMRPAEQTSPCKGENGCNKITPCLSKSDVTDTNDESRTIPFEETSLALECTLILKRASGQDVQISLMWTNGYLGRNGMGQLLQYLKNNMK